MRTLLSSLALTWLLLAGAAALAEEPFSYDTVNPGARFQYDSITTGRDIQPSGTLGGTEGPGVPEEPPGGYTGARSMIDCGPGARYISPVDADRVGRLYPLACGGRR